MFDGAIQTSMAQNKRQPHHVTLSRKAGGRPFLFAGMKPLPFLTDVRSRTSPSVVVAVWFRRAFRRQKIGNFPFLCVLQHPPHIETVTMKLLCFASLLAVATAFTTQPNAFTTKLPLVGGRDNGDGLEQQNGAAHRTRRATIVMGGKANGEST